MITSILRFQFRNEVNEQQKLQALKIIEKTAKVEPVAFYTIGRYFGEMEDTYTHSYCASFHDLEALSRYFREPVHREGDFLFIPLLSQLSQMTISDETDPDLIKKIMTCRNEALDPEWIALFDRFSGV